ncbi:hypothetical protein D5S17_11800 [Pseudonocardiaceae bacterium YIM PH 21723]|nr:hypothetical protein D5S17_11800 [Pseudonocardiaceae bacterium YIM PH 21723]
MHRNMIKAGLIITAAVLTLTACGGDKKDDAKDNTGSASASVIGPNGWDKLKLKDNLDTAKQTGELGDTATAAGTCQSYPVKDKDAQALFSTDKGLVKVQFKTGDVKTPEGIGAGSTVSELRAKYPSTQVGPDGYFTKVPGKDEYTYTFDADGRADGSKITTFGVQVTGETCK